MARIALCAANIAWAIDTGDRARAGGILPAIWRILREAPGICLGITGHDHCDQDEERAHDNYPYQQNVAWLWQRYQTSANLCPLAKFAVRLAPSASCPARCGRSQSVFSVVRRFRNSALSVSSLRDLSQRFAKSVLLPTQWLSSKM